MPERVCNTNVSEKLLGTVLASCHIKAFLLCVFFCLFFLLLSVNVVLVCFFICFVPFGGCGYGG